MLVSIKEFPLSLRYFCFGTCSREWSLASSTFLLMFQKESPIKPILALLSLPVVIGVSSSSHQNHLSSWFSAEKKLAKLHVNLCNVSGSSSRSGWKEDFSKKRKTTNTRFRGWCLPFPISVFPTWVLLPLSIHSQVKGI